MYHTFAILGIVLCHQFTSVVTSQGDRSYVYQNCFRFCINGNCTSDGISFKSNAVLHQDFWCKLLLWSCTDECKYHCMWQTVQGFLESGDTVPQFHGKWPFKRILGVQEPASAFASVLNLVSNAYMYVRIQREFPVRTMPVVLFWHVFAIVCMNAWIWSTIFHTRDTPFTEFMDYTCALSMVMGLFVAAVVRIFHKRRKLTATLLIFPLLYFVTHIRYLYSGRIDYDYNMKVNIIFVSGSALWVAWAWRACAGGARYAWRVLAFAAASGAALALELAELAPARGWDAHALWHLATAPLPLLFYQFVIDDLRHMQSGQLEKFGFKVT